MCRIGADGRAVCVEDPLEDADQFNGLEFCDPLWRARFHASALCAQGSLVRRPAAGAGAAQQDNDDDDDDVDDDDEEVGTDLLDDQPRRDIIAAGMRRFEGHAKKAPSQLAVERLSPRVVSVLGQNPSPYTLNGTNCYLVGTGARRVLIDAGDNPAVGPRYRRNHEEFMRHLDRTLREERCEIETVLVTHLHSDHFGGVEGILDRFGQHVRVGMLEAPDHLLSLTTLRELRARGLIDACERSPNPFAGGVYNHGAGDDAPPPDFDASWDVAGRTPREIARDYWIHRHHASFYNAWHDDSNGSIRALKLRHGDVVAVEGATLRVVRTPGHSENHAAFCLDEEHSIFSGDHVLGFGTTIMSDAYDYMASLDAMRRYEPRRLYPGHGPHIADGTGLLNRYHEHRTAREDQVVHLLADASEFGAGAFLPTAADIAGKLYTHTLPERMGQATENVERILLKLWREGRAVVFSDREGRVPALLPEAGYLRRLGTDLAWRHCEQDDASAERWRRRVEAIVNATAGGRAGDSGAAGGAAGAKL